MKPEIRNYATFQAMSDAAAAYVLQIAENSVQERGHFTLALSGGTTPKSLYACLTSEPYVHAIPWKQTHIFWGDERYVPPNHPYSNFAMAAQVLLERIPIPAENIHRIPTEAASAEIAAVEYAETLHAVFHALGMLSEDQQFPRCDLVLLGMGADGHTASLFPGSPILEEKQRWVAAIPAPNIEPRVERITLILPVLNAARNLLFLVAGVEKQPIVQTIIEHPEQARRVYPAANIQPVNGNLTWFVT